jgi:hypothetical protein
MELGPLRQDSPPAGDVPVAVPGDLVLVRSSGLVAWVGALTVTSAGFEFTLSVTAGTGGPEVAFFALNEDERDDHTWMGVRFADGRETSADLNSHTWPGGSENLWLGYLYGDAMGTAGWDDSRWWVSPLPPSGRVELTVHLNGAAGPSGTGTLDGQVLLDAASAVETAWSQTRRDAP